MFLLVSGGHIGVPERNTNMAFPYKALNGFHFYFSLRDSASQKYNMCHGMLYNICHAMLYNMCHIMLYNINYVMYITYLMLCYITYVMFYNISRVMLYNRICYAI